jgi:hypothetical protein
VADFSNAVFVNCPFDADYKPIFDAIVFAITDLGFIARSAREGDDGGETRLSKIQGIIEQCRYGVHDISAVQLNPHYQLPRFNMPLELGLFLGCKRYGERSQQKKVALILDSEPHRYQIFISDIAGQDIHSHNNDVRTAIRELRTWLATESRRKRLPGGQDIFNRYQRFQAVLPSLCEELRLAPEEVTFKDLRQMAADWLSLNR